MKVAIVHDWFIDWAGAERVVEQILACFPDADLFALVDFLPEIHREKLLNKHVQISFLQEMPFAKRALRYYLPWMPIAIEQLDLSIYDVIISSSHAVAKGVITGPNQLHISYVHSPMRYAWDMHHDYLRGKLGKGLRGIALRWTLHYLRQWDIRTANSVDLFIANSEFVAKRIHKFYRREAVVIHPPVDIAAFPLVESKKDFYICAGRLERYKRIDIAVDAFKNMPDKKLIIMGYGPELNSLRSNAPTNVTFIGSQPHDKWLRHLQSAKALIFPGIEDFGITPVEAQACGTPVIGIAKGGLSETVTPLGLENATGVLVPKQEVAEFVNAVHVFEQNVTAILPKTCRQNASRFSIEVFKRNLSAFVNTAVLEKRLG